MRSTLAYTTARILLFVAATGLLYLAGLRSVLLLGAALLVSGIFSYYNGSWGTLSLMAMSGNFWDMTQ